MRVVVYHEVRPESLEQVLRAGLKRSDEGEKSDAVVQRTDDCLEDRMPADLARRGLSRRSVVYGFLSSGDKLVDIRDGREVGVEQFAAERELVLLRFDVDSADCFVSDLDAYDAIKVCVDSGAEDALLSRLAQRYWERVVPVDDYDPGRYRRPEVMVLNDIAAEDITIASADA